VSFTTGEVPSDRLRVLLADEDEAALETLAEVVEALGHEVTPFAVSVADAIQLIAGEDPDLAIVMVHHDDEHALSLIEEAVDYASGPVIALMRQGDARFVARAADRGIAASIDSLAPEAVQGAIEVALRRHREARGLAVKVEQLETALERRALIERAKGVLMERHGVDERAAFELVREQARATNRRVVDVAAAVLSGHALPPRR